MHNDCYWSPSVEEGGVNPGGNVAETLKEKPPTPTPFALWNPTKLELGIVECHRETRILAVRTPTTRHRAPNWANHRGPCPLWLSVLIHTICTNKQQWKPDYQFVVIRPKYQTNANMPGTMLVITVWREITRIVSKGNTTKTFIFKYKANSRLNVFLLTMAYHYKWIEPQLLLYNHILNRFWSYATHFFIMWPEAKTFVARHYWY